MRPVGAGAAKIRSTCASSARRTRTSAALVAEGSFRAGPLLPHQRDRAARAAAARTRRGHSAARATIAEPARERQNAPTPQLDAEARKLLCSLSISRATCASSRTSSSARSRCARVIEIDVDDLQLPRARRPTPSGTTVEHRRSGRSGRISRTSSATAIMKALEQTRYNKTAAAKKLGITFRALRYRIKKLGIE